MRDTSHPDTVQKEKGNEEEPKLNFFGKVHNFLMEFIGFDPDEYADSPGVNHITVATSLVDEYLYKNNREEPRYEYSYQVLMKDGYIYIVEVHLNGLNGINKTCMFKVYPYYTNHEIYTLVHENISEMMKEFLDESE